MSLHHIYTCFQAFDKDHDGSINLEEFRLICQALFRNDRGFVYRVNEQKLKEMFTTFDRSLNNALEIEDFMFCWYNWFKYIIHPRSVCIVVNMQNDYVSGVMSLVTTTTAAPENDSEENQINIIEPINIILATCEFEKVYYIMDWHPSNHISFYENVNLRPIHPNSKFTEQEAKLYDTVVFAIPTPYEQKLWPKHCVENTWGSELDMNLRISSKSTRIYTGTNPERDQYSAFRDSTMPIGSFHAELQKMNITDIYVVGIAYDLCVRATCLDALGLGYRTILVEDCCKAMDPNLAEQTKQEIITRNGVVVQSQDVKNMIEGKDRRAELGYMLAMKLKNWIRKKSTRSGLLTS